MKASIELDKKKYTIDLAKPLDISIPLRGNAQNVNAWYLGHPKIEPHRDGDFVGRVAEGGSTNFNDIWFNPHAHGTHTECVGHITEEFHSVNQNLDRYFFRAELVTVVPELREDDWVVSRHVLDHAMQSAAIEALIIRTAPNGRDKLSKHYSHTNPPYVLPEAVELLLEKGVRHLLVDLPSIDKEKDGGALSAHKTFWDFNGQLRKNATITEFVYVPDGIEDGFYFLNLQVAAFENDASPSRPVLYKIEP
ncbi:cyclase family protein [Pseudozobellia thermophila]|uniref:Kynurenine formamidase n=1 Tax=Pseudozobellia thermophila TaxID=192903 RepID=A0A1M6MZP5_9FLAO|nr:cyclase family protein [Pseudozobellia thermophila]SHJ88870.1 Kynurenine formamidase [Pseudozobellia thermophila]